jgi:hypothetical protein
MIQKEGNYMDDTDNLVEGRKFGKITQIYRYKKRTQVNK